MTEFLLNIFKWINDVVTNNFGLTIILFTVLFRIICLPVDFYSRKGQRDYAIKMNAMKGEMDLIMKAYKNDPQRQQQEMMALRKKHGVGMMPKGCFSQLLVYPLLIAFFAVFRNMAAMQIQQLSDLVTQYGAESAEVTAWFSENSFLWIKNIWMPDNLVNTTEMFLVRLIPLINGISCDVVPVGNQLAQTMAAIGTDNATLEVISANMNAVKDTALAAGANGLFILPVLSGVLQYFSMKITNKLNPQNAAMEMANPGAASGNKMTKFMTVFFPILFGWICLTSSSALAIYWITSSVVMTAFNVAIAKFLDYMDKKKEQAAMGVIKE